MARSKIYKIAAVVAVVFLIAALAFYAQLSNRHKAIVKTTFLHKTGLVDNIWNISDSPLHYKMQSPTFLIDGIYKSMEGPKASNFVQLSRDSTLLFITGFSVRAVDAKTEEPISNDFICHTNVDFNDVRYFSNFGLKDRIGKSYPRMTSLSNGQEAFQFPEGYGVPMLGNDLLYVTTESLNHNLPDLNKLIKHEVSIDYVKEALKPLMSRTVFIQLPFDANDPFKPATDKGADYCIPVETKNHTYADAHGNKLSGHWVIPIGKSSYKSSITMQLQIKDSLRLHAAAIHVHPFATSITLYDKTLDKAIFTSAIQNHKGKIGLAKIADFTTQKGIWLHGWHEYELQLETNNTTKENQDMMASMFLFFYDKELDGKINTMRL